MTITITKVAEDVGISIGSCHAIFSDILGLKRVAAKFVPKLLNFDLLTRHCFLVIFWPKKTPYSPDWAPCDFFLFPRLKRPMKRRRFATIKEIKTESLRELKVVISWLSESHKNVKNILDLHRNFSVVKS